MYAITIFAILTSLTLVPAQDINLTGTVTDCAGRPVAGADVTLVHYDVTATTDSHGVYEIMQTVGVRNVLTPQNVFYSLSDSRLRLTLAGASSVSVAFYNLKGKRIQHFDFHTLSGGKHHLALPELKAAGLYVMTVNIGSTRYVHQVFSNPTGSLTIMRNNRMSPARAFNPFAKQSAAADSLEVTAGGFRGSTVPVDSLNGTIDAVLMTADEFLEHGGACPPDVLHMVTFKMGHTGFLFVFPNGETMLVDTGQHDTPGKMMDFFRAHGITHIDYVQLSHNHGDHTGGVEPLTEAGYITDETHFEGCMDYKVGDRFERAGTSWYIYNADRGGGCDDNEDSLAYWMWFNGFRFSGGGDEYKEGKKELVENTSLDLDEFFPVDVRYENGHCYDDEVRCYWPFEELLDARFSICTLAPEREQIERLEAFPRNERVIRQNEIHIIRVTGDKMEGFYCESEEDCPIELPERR